MKPQPNLFTPIVFKRNDETWSDESAFFMLAANGLFLCRNHAFFRSSVPAPNFPSELAEQPAFMRLNFPPIPRRLFEVAVGYFARIYQLHQSEAGLLLIWNEQRKRMELLCPPQLATVSVGRTGVWPIGLHYEIPELEDHQLLLGDLHSHADESAYASHTDKADEKTKPAGSLHIVIGRCNDALIGKRPDIHVETVVDGYRFRVQPEQVIGGYRKPRLNVPRAWIDQVKVEAYKSVTYSTPH